MNSVIPVIHSEPTPQPRRLQRNDYLALPKHQRVIPQYSTHLDGTLEMRLNFGSQNVSFVSPDLFEFGEALSRHAMFRAESAVTWGVGYHWDQIGELLRQLLDRGILHYASPDHDAPVRGTRDISAQATALSAGFRMGPIKDLTGLQQSQ
jgi:hypothetical protein